MRRASERLERAADPSERLTERAVDRASVRADGARLPPGRVLLESSAASYCDEDQKPLWSLTVIHQTHLVIFALGATYIMYCLLTICITMHQVLTPSPARPRRRGPPLLRSVALLDSPSESVVGKDVAWKESEGGGCFCVCVSVLGNGPEGRPVQYLDALPPSHVATLMVEFVLKFGSRRGGCAVKHAGFCAQGNAHTTESAEVGGGVHHYIELPCVSIETMLTTPDILVEQNSSQYCNSHPPILWIQSTGFEWCIVQR